MSAWTLFLSRIRLCFGRALALSAGVVLGLAAAPASATNEIESFYKGKNI